MSSFEPEYPIDAELWLTGWHGTSREPCQVVGATPKRYRIKAEKRIQLGGRNRWLEPGKTALVPRRSITFVGRENRI